MFYDFVLPQYMYPFRLRDHWHSNVRSRAMAIISKENANSKSLPGKCFKHRMQTMVRVGADTGNVLAAAPALTQKH